MATSQVDISGEVRSICGKLGLDPKRVRELVISPTEAVAQVYVPDADGDLHLVRGEVPMATVTTSVRT